VDKRELEKRTKRFALRIVKFVAALPSNKITNVLGYQLLKAGTSIGANYREANRAVSRNDFINKTCAEPAEVLALWRRSVPSRSTGWSSAMRRT